MTPKEWAEKAFADFRIEGDKNLTRKPEERVSLVDCFERVLEAALEEDRAKQSRPWS